MKRRSAKRKKKSSNKVFKALLKSEKAVVERETRLECLRIAGAETGPADVISAAEQYFGWVMGKVRKAEKAKPRLAVISPIKQEGIHDEGKDK